MEWSLPFPLDWVCFAWLGHMIIGNTDYDVIAADVGGKYIRPLEAIDRHVGLMLDHIEQH
jgi:hypothetical protein